jgi:high-affinity iron transporter
MACNDVWHGAQGVFVHQRNLVLCLLFVLALLGSRGAGAAGPTPAQTAETIRAALVEAQLAAHSDATAARRALATAQAAYGGAFRDMLVRVTPAAAARVAAGFAAADRALATNDLAAFAAARAEVWTAVLGGGYSVVEQALASGDGRMAQAWLQAREFRVATRFSRPAADATVAVDQVVAGTLRPADALLTVRADLLDTYQARLAEALHKLPAAQRQGFATQRAEQAANAAGYFAILSPAYREQRGPAALARAQQAFAALQSAANSGAGLDAALAQVDAALHGFRAAPLSPAEQTRRAGQMLRFLSLVPVEYRRGVKGNTVTRDLEVREATTFRNGAAAAFGDLESLLEARDAARTGTTRELLAKLEADLAAAGRHADVPTPDTIQATTDELLATLKAAMPSEWQKQDSSADFDVVAAALDQMESAATARQYDLAESARLEAYAILETGPEARLVAFAPQMIPRIEELFWYGQSEHKGLAQLIAQRASLAEIKASRSALDGELKAAQGALAGQNAPMAVATNAAIIVFREGLEAVLILASLLGSLKLGENRKLRRPIWIGAAAAFGASVLTWLLARGILQSLARYGERLEAVVSLIAIAVLLLITNWFFHKVYWTGWMANFHAQKKRIIGGNAGLWLGLIALGFSSIYREGFETVLFLQALVLEAGTPTVLGGVALGLAGTLLIGLLVFVLQAKLPHKKMLIATGIMIGAVLLIMVGNTAHVLQVVGWLPIHPIRGLALPYWSGLWLGLYATWEGIGLQVAAGAFVIGSYLLAEQIQHGRVQKPRASTVARSA